MNHVFREALGYAIVSAVALAADFGILFVLVHFFDWWYLAAASVSFSVGVLIAYVLSVRLVFKERRLANARMEFLTFAAIGALGLAVNSGVMLACVQLAGLNYLIAKAVAAIFTFACNFLARRQLLFVGSTAV